MGPIYKFVMSLLAKRAGKKTGIATISRASAPSVKLASEQIHKILTNMGVDVTKLRSADEVEKYLNIQKSWVKQQKPKVIGQGHPEFEGITEALFGKKKATVTKLPEGGKDKVPVTQQFTGKSFTADDHIKFIKSKPPIEAMKEANSVIGRKGRYKNLSHDEADRILKDTEDHIFERNIPEEDFASGGIAGQLHLNRPGFNKGKKVDLSKRKFLKGAGAGLGVLSMLPFVGKFFKPAAKAAKALTKVPITQTADMPNWFVPLVNKVIKQGDDVTKQYATVERQIVHKTKLPESKTDVLVTQDLTSGDVSVDIGLSKHGFPDGHLGQPTRLIYKASEEVPYKTYPGGKVQKGSTKTKEEFWVDEAEFTGGHPENIKFEESVSEKFGEHGSNFDEVEKFATGTVKKKTGKESIKAERAHWTPEGDYASGGRVPFGKGKIAKGLYSLIKPKPKTKGKIWKDETGETKGMAMGFSPEEMKGLDQAMSKGMAMSNAMKKMGYDPSKLSDYNKFDELVEGGMSGVSKEMRTHILKAKYGDVLPKDLLDNMIATDDPQKLATVMGTVDEAVIMQERGMGTEDIIHTMKESLKRRPQAHGGIAGQLHLNQGGEVWPAGRERFLEEKIDDDFWINHYKQVLDARIGAMEARKEGGRKQNPEDVEYILEQYNELEKYGGDPTEFNERIQNLSNVERIGINQGGRARFQDGLTAYQQGQNIIGGQDDYDLTGMRDPFQPSQEGGTPDVSGKTYYDDGSYTIPGFTRLKNPDGAPGNYNEFMYRGPDGQIYGAETYGAISVGRYPDIYDPNSYYAQNESAIREGRMPAQPTNVPGTPIVPTGAKTGQNIGRWNPDKSLVQTGVNSSGFPIWHDPKEAAAMGILPTTDYEDKSLLSRGIEAAKGVGQDLLNYGSIPANFAAGITGLPIGYTTQDMRDTMDAAARANAETGHVGYADLGAKEAYGNFLGMNPGMTSAQRALALTSGDVDFKIDPATGKINYDPATLAYDFNQANPMSTGNKESGAITNFINRGGLMGQRVYTPMDSTFDPTMTQLESVGNTEKIARASQYADPRMQVAQAKGIDPRMGRTYAENIQAMGDPRMRGAKGGLARILGV